MFEVNNGVAKINGTKGKYDNKVSDPSVKYGRNAVENYYTYVEQPLVDKEEIIKRQDFIEILNQQEITREELREYLNPIYDLERLITRITYQLSLIHI